MDELLVSWLGNDTVWEEVQNLVESYRKNNTKTAESSSPRKTENDGATSNSPRGVIPPFYPKSSQRRVRRWKNTNSTTLNKWLPRDASSQACVRDQVRAILDEMDTDTFGIHDFTKITKDVCQFPSFFSGPLFNRISGGGGEEEISMEMMQNFWKAEMEPYDAPERFFRLVKQPENDYIGKDDFLPYIKELLNDHPVSILEVGCFSVGCFAALLCTRSPVLSTQYTVPAYAIFSHPTLHAPYSILCA